MKKILFLIFFISTKLLAGEKGLDVILLNIGDADFYDNAIYGKYSENIAAGKQDACWSKYGDGVSGIAHITKKKLPKGIDISVAKEIWMGDVSAVIGARKIMHQDDGLTESGDGYHGMYIIKPEGNKLTLMGVGANEDRKKGLSGISEKITITLDEKDPKKAARQFEQALCKVSKPFNIGFSI